jgi:hypothetical protein
MDLIKYGRGEKHDSSVLVFVSCKSLYDPYI